MREDPRARTAHLGDGLGVLLLAKGLQLRHQRPRRECGLHEHQAHGERHSAHRAGSHVEVGGGDGLAHLKEPAEELRKAVAVVGLQRRLLALELLRHVLQLARSQAVEAALQRVLRRADGVRVLNAVRGRGEAVLEVDGLEGHELDADAL